MLMSDFETAVNFVLANEGKIEKNGHDKGGITNHGISLRFLKSLDVEKLKKYGIFDLEITEDTIRFLSLDQSKKIYHGEFWEHTLFEKIENQEYCNYIFDMAVNIGISPAIKCVQRACWAVMHYWEKLPDDGILGENTLAAIKLCGFLIMPALRAERGSYYRNLAQNVPDQKEFLIGWYNRTYNT